MLLRNPKLRDTYLTLGVLIYMEDDNYNGNGDNDHGRGKEGGGGDDSCGRYLSFLLHTCLFLELMAEYHLR